MIRYGPLEKTLGGKSIEEVLGKKVRIKDGKFLGIENLERLCTALECGPSDVFEFDGNTVDCERIAVDWDVLREKKEASGKSWEALSNECGLSPHTLNRACVRESSVDSSVLKVLCKVLKCGMGDVKKKPVPKEDVGDDFPTEEPIKGIDPEKEMMLKKMGLKRGTEK